MPEKITPRIAWIDLAKGIVIILMVLGHIIDTDTDLLKFIYVFHMPFFFVTAGYLLNLSKWGRAENYKPFATKLFKRLLVPYYIANFLWYPLLVAKENYSGHLLRIIFYSSPVEAFLGIFVGVPVMLPLGPLWFLPCLLLTELIFVKLCSRLAKNSVEVFTLSIVLSAYAGFALSRFGYLPFGINVALAAQIFLLAGVLVRRYNVVERMSLKLCGALTLLLVVAFQINARVEMAGAFFGEPLLFYAGGLSGSLLVMKLSALMTEGKVFALISACGRQSLMILILHPLIIELLYNVMVRNTSVTLAQMCNDPLLVLFTTLVGVLIPLLIAERFGKFPVLKYFCP